MQSDNSSEDRPILKTLIVKLVDNSDPAASKDPGAELCVGFHAQQVRLCAPGAWHALRSPMTRCLPHRIHRPASPWRKRLPLPYTSVIQLTTCHSCDTWRKFGMASRVLP